MESWCKSSSLLQRSLASLIKQIKWALGHYTLTLESSPFRFDRSFTSTSIVHTNRGERGPSVRDVTNRTKLLNRNQTDARPGLGPGSQTEPSFEQLSSNMPVIYRVTFLQNIQFMFAASGKVEN